MLLHGSYDHLTGPYFTVGSWKGRDGGWTGYDKIVRPAMAFCHGSFQPVSSFAGISGSPPVIHHWTDSLAVNGRGRNCSGIQDSADRLQLLYTPAPRQMRCRLLLSQQTSCRVCSSVGRHFYFNCRSQLTFSVSKRILREFSKAHAISFLLLW